MKRILCLRVENQDRRVGFSPPSRDGGLKPTLQADALQSVAARCKQFTPLVGIDADVFPQSVLLDITNVAHLFDGEAALVERILAELHAEGWQLRAAVAGTPGAAWALAWYGGKEEEREKGRKGEGENLSFSLSSVFRLLPLEALRLPEPIVALLHSLGVWRIGELEALPRRELSSRFGPELLDCLDRVTGRVSEPLPAWDPPPPFEVRWSAEFPTARRETLEAALEHLVRRLAAMLTRAGRGAMRLECLLQCTAGRGTSGHLGAPAQRVGGSAGRRVGGSASRLPVVVGLFRPSAWANHLVELLQVRFESLQLPGPVDSIRLTAASTAPLEVRQQEMFSEGQTRAGPHHLSGLIDRLSNRLGHARVMRVRLIPDAQPELACHYTPLVLGRAGIKRSAKGATQRPTPLSQPRPLRLLTQPVRLPGGIDELFSFAGRQQQIVRRVGPERIETGWWRGGHHVPMVGVARDYYRIETATGRWYWVFRRLPAGPWFLHGMFD